MSPPAWSRRRFLETASLLPLAAALSDAGGLTWDAASAASSTTYRFFTKHEAKVIDAAVRRIAPGPDDDALEAGHPGAHEANVVRYLDRLLSVFEDATPKLFADGPWSNRHTHGTNHMKHFIEPDVAQSHAWRQRVAGLRHTYREGVKRLDAAVSGSFAAQSQQTQDQVLASSDLADFTAILFGHTIEGMYCVPEYGGNAGLVSWKEIKFPGDRQPKGYTAAELAEVQVDVIEPTGVVALLLANFDMAAKAMASGGWRHA